LVCGQLFFSLFFFDFHRTNFSDSAGPFTSFDPVGFPQRRSPQLCWRSRKVHRARRFECKQADITHLPDDGENLGPIKRGARLDVSFTPAGQGGPSSGAFMRRGAYQPRAVPVTAYRPLPSRWTQDCNGKSHDPKNRQARARREYAAEVEVDLIEDEGGWSPYLSVADAAKLDAVRNALRNGDLATAARHGSVFELKPVLG
jgi:hypothetical protein